MQDNEFEKQVRQKLKGLNLEAGNTVWDKVEERLHKKEKRRRWLMWIPVGVTGVLLSALFLSKMEIGTSGKEQVASETKTTPAGKNLSGKERGSNTITYNSKNEKGETNISEAEDKLKNNRSETELNTKPALPGVINELKDVRKHDGHSLNNKRQNKSTLFPDDFKKQQFSVFPNKKTTLSPWKNKVLENEGNNIVRSGAIDTADQPFSTESMLTRELSSSRINSQIAFEKVINVQPGNYAMLKMPLQKISKNIGRFAWGIEAGMGRSGIASGRLGNLFFSPAASVSNYYSAVTPGNNGGSQAGANRTPSQVRPGLSASLGVFIRQPLEDPLYLKVGIRYEVFSTLILVGNKQNQSLTLQSFNSQADRSVGSYYTSDKTEKYTNRYNFIEMPVAIGIKLAKRSKLPFAWEIGIAPGILFASNALNFNQSSAIYYKDNSLFRKTQWQLFTALPVKVFNGKSYTMEIVPRFSYHTTSLFKPEVDATKHLLVAGLSIRANF